MSHANAPSLEVRQYRGIMDWITTVDHKKIGLMYFWFALIMGLVGGGFAGAIRLQLMAPEAVWENFNAARVAGSLEANSAWFADNRLAFNRMTTMHASVMIFTVIIPAFAAFANFIVPLMLGARDMAFPKMNAFAFWLLIPAGLLMMASFFVEGGAAATGWTAYPPLSLQDAGNPGQDMWVLAIHMAGLSSILGAINFIVTISNMRAPGMGWMKLPLFAWATYITSIIQLIATPVLGAAVTMILLDRNFGTGFLDTTRGGDPVLYQHIFWFYSHPAVYIMILPGFGAVSHILGAFSQKRVFGYVAMVASIASIAVLGFLVWAHHMFSVGMPTWAQAFFMYASMAIALPTGIKIFSWLATLWGGKIRFTTAMLYSLGFISLFVLGGFGGLILALVPIDIQLHDTYFVVGHFHYTLVGGSLMLIFAMTYYWWPKMTGRYLNELWGKIGFVLMFLGIFIAFGTMHISGALGMARRIPIYREEFLELNQITTFGYLLTAIAALIIFLGICASYFRRPTASGDAWDVNDIQRSFEWATTSPPPVYNYETVPPIPVTDPKLHPIDEDAIARGEKPSSHH
ncbi:MAG: cytochrome c oxidase subunit I [Planctomycetota bacterium]|nr:MAG: cytochrome c oxidase subunit I [Planctomycetota bacterium]